MIFVLCTYIYKQKKKKHLGMETNDKIILKKQNGKIV